MIYETIDLNIKDNVAVLTLDRPAVMNALNAQMRAEILHAVRHSTEVARVLVMTGAGIAFCSGQDLNDSGVVGKIDLERSLRDQYSPMLQAITDSPIPTISAVNGPAAGAGANLALAADVVIAADNAYFAQAFTRIGLMPDAGGTYTLPRRMGMAKAMGAALFAEKISAQQAEDWGMIWEVAAPDGFDALWKSRAAHLANGPSVAYTHTKTALSHSLQNTYEQQLMLEAKLQGDCGKTRDFKEGVLAFLEKRPAVFEGR